MNRRSRQHLEAGGSRAGVVIGVLGPTGVGKTAVAVEIARALDTRVVSCDSMQLYRGFPVLTNQPSDDAARGLHEMVGVVDPGESLSAAGYAEAARPIIERELAHCGWALVAGGSGLYMRAALAPLRAGGKADPEVRRQLEERARNEGGTALYAELLSLDEEAARSIDPRNVRRVVRALESVQSTGRAWSGRGDLWDPCYYHPTLLVGLTADRVAVACTIQERSQMMVSGGAVEEVRLYRSELGEERTRPGTPGICSAIGYEEVCAYLEGKTSRVELVESIASATRKYARRQLTWLRKVKDAVMIDVRGRTAPEVAEEILALAVARASGKESGQA